MDRSPRTRVAVFLVALVIFTVGTIALASRSGSRAASFAIMCSPALAAIAASLLTRRSLLAIGWKPWPLKWLGLGWLFPLLYAFPAYALIWATGLGGVPKPTFFERGRVVLGMPTEPEWQVVVAAFFFITVLNLLPATILSLGEEIGWRGFLAPELTRWLGFRTAAVASGAVWALWHWHGVLTGAYGAGETPLAYRLLCFTVMVIATAVPLAWLRLRSGSIWPVAIMHATHNGAIQAFFEALTVDTGPTPWFRGEFGAALLPFTLALAWWCWRRPPAAPAEAEAAPAPAPRAEALGST